MTLLEPIPAFSDNYIWLIAGDDGRATVVDPGDAEPVLARLAQLDLTLSDVLVTHKHGDHTGGLGPLREAFPDLRIHGPIGEPIHALTHHLVENDQVAPAGFDQPLRVLEVPGHTEGHIAFFGQGLLFCGDTLFGCGCGRVFSGTFEQLAASLRRIASLPGETLVCCAHEYTLDNIGFAKWVTPDHPPLLQREQQDMASRAAGEPTLPCRLALERETNPFLRWQDEQVIAAASTWYGSPLSDPTQVFTALRQWKDRDYD